MDEEFAFYLFYLIAIISVVCAFLYAYSVLLRQDIYNELQAIAAGRLRPKNIVLKEIHNRLRPPLLPWHHPARLWRIGFITISWFGFLYISYNIAFSLLKWMPRGWRDEDGAWAAESWAFGCSFLMLIGIASIGGKLAEKITVYERNTELLEFTIRFNELLKYIYTYDKERVDFWRNYILKILLWDERRQHASVHTKEIILLNMLSDYCLGNKFNYEEELSKERKTKSLDDLVSKQALDLIEYCNSFEDYWFVIKWAEFEELLPKSPFGAAAPVNLDYTLNRRYTLKQKRQRLIEQILWADQTGVVDIVDKYIRKSG